MRGTIQILYKKENLQKIHSEVQL